MNHSVNLDLNARLCPISNFNYLMDKLHENHVNDAAMTLCHTSNVCVLRSLRMNLKSQSKMLLLFCLTVRLPLHQKALHIEGFMLCRFYSVPHKYFDYIRCFL